MLSKHIILIVGVVVDVLVVGVLFLNSNYPGVCSYSDINGNTIKLCQDFVLVLMPVGVLLPIAIILYFIRDGVFRTWLKFMYILVPAAVLSVLLSPDENYSLFPVEKARVSLLFTLLIFFISILVILIKSIQVYRKK